MSGHGSKKLNRKHSIFMLNPPPGDNISRAPPLDTSSFPSRKFRERDYRLSNKEEKNLELTCGCLLGAEIIEVRIGGRGPD